MNFARVLYERTRHQTDSFQFQDVELINKGRFLLNSVLGARCYGSTVYSQQAPSLERMREVSGKMLQLLWQLINIPRSKDVDVVYPSQSHQWNVVKKEHILKCDASVNQTTSVVPLHDSIKLITERS